MENGKEGEVGVVSPKIDFKSQRFSDYIFVV